MTTNATTPWTHKPAPVKKTMFYTVFAEQPASLPDWVWKPWINCDDNTTDMTRQLVVNRFIRDRGGIEGLKKVFLYEHSEDAPRHANGNLKQVNVIEYFISPFTG